MVVFKNFISCTDDIKKIIFKDIQTDNFSFQNYRFTGNCRYFNMIQRFGGLDLGLENGYYSKFIKL